jgi:hypothetical protein
VVISLNPWVFDYSPFEAGCFSGESDRTKTRKVEAVNKRILSLIEIDLKYRKIKPKPSIPLLLPQIPAFTPL